MNEHEAKAVLVMTRLMSDLKKNEFICKSSLVSTKPDYVDAINNRSNDNKLAERGSGSLTKVDCLSYRGKITLSI